MYTNFQLCTFNMQNCANNVCNYVRSTTKNFQIMYTIMYILRNTNFKRKYTILYIQIHQFSILHIQCKYFFKECTQLYLCTFNTHNF